VVQFGAGWICTHEEETNAIVILSAEREESRRFLPVVGSLGILHPLKRVQNDKGTHFFARRE